MSKIKTHDAGCFNRLMTIENEVDVEDGCGGFTKNFTGSENVWAHICPVKAGFNTEADSAHLRISHKILIRFRPGITTSTRFVSGSRKFYVETVHDPDETKRYLECQTQERAI